MKCLEEVSQSNHWTDAVNQRVFFLTVETLAEQKLFSEEVNEVEVWLLTSLVYLFLLIL